MYVIEFLSILISLSILNSIINPPLFQREASMAAKQNGWPVPIIILTRSFQHFTVYSLLWTLASLYTLEPNIMFIGLSLSWLVFIAYHGINFIDPMHLAYHPEELVKLVVGCKPPLSVHIIPWTGLHFQHTIFPFYLFYKSIEHNTFGRLSPYIHIYCHAALLFYVVWHLFCWNVQGIPAYPFLIRLREMKYEVLFYILGFSIMTVKNSFLTSGMQQ